MQMITTLSLLLAAGLGISAAPAADAITGIPANDGAALSELRAPRFSCGQYKFSNGVVQEFYSLVWAGKPPNQKVCRYFKYEFHDKKGQEGTMVAAKVDFGCTCFFYAVPCDPNAGYTETWEGWKGWENYAWTDKKFKGWYCLEHD